MYTCFVFFQFKNALICNGVAVLLIVHVHCHVNVFILLKEDCIPICINMCVINIILCKLHMENMYICTVLAHLSTKCSG